MLNDLTKNLSTCNAASLHQLKETYQVVKKMIIYQRNAHPLLILFLLSSNKDRTLAYVITRLSLCAHIFTFEPAGRMEVDISVTPLEATLAS
jgi:hypothetical protein